MVIFSERDMRHDQIVEMKESFSDNGNIIVLSVEGDLNDCLDSLPDICRYKKTAFCFLDPLRIAVIKDAKKVLSVALSVAEKENKEIAKIGLIKEFESIQYTDMDNEFLEQSPDYVISRRGMYSFPVLSQLFSLLFVDESLLSQLSTNESQMVKKYKNYFTGHPYLDDNNHQAIWSNDKILNSFEYIFSGKARLEFINLCKTVEDISLTIPFPENIRIWSGDNGLISVKHDAMDIFKNEILTEIRTIDCFVSPENKNRHNFDRFYSLSHSLVGIQLWRTFFGSHDYSWIE